MMVKRESTMTREAKCWLNKMWSKARRGTTRHQRGGVWSMEAVENMLEEFGVMKATETTLAAEWHVQSDLAYSGIR